MECEEISSEEREERKMCNTEPSCPVREESSQPPPGEASPVLELVPGSQETCQSQAAVQSQCQEQEEAGDSSLLGKLLEDNIQSVASSLVSPEATASSLKRLVDVSQCSSQRQFLRIMHATNAQG